MTDLLREILQVLSNNKLRTFLTGVSVAWGIFMLIVLLSASRGVLNAFRDHAESRGTSSVSIWGGYTSKPFGGYKEGRRIRITENDMATLQRELPETVGSTTADISMDAADVATSRDYITGGLYGVYPSYRRSSGVNMVKGRFINQRDMDEKRKVVVLSRSNAAVLFDDSDKAVGQTVKSLGLVFTVVGVFDNGGWNITFAPFSTVAQLKGNDGNVNSIRVNVDGVSNEVQGLEAEKEIRSTLARVHRFDPDDSSGVWIWNQFVNNLTMFNVLRLLNIAMWVIGVLTLISGVVGVSNIMFVSVRERTHEIGIRRAIGARPRSILTQIVAESVVITTMFGYLGILLGIVATEILVRVAGEVDFLKNPTVDISIAFSVTAVLIMAGMLAGLFPALKALRVKPVEALRDE